MTTLAPSGRRAVPVIVLPLAGDGRVAAEHAQRRLGTELAEATPPVTDCFVLAPGWLRHPDEARAMATYLFAQVDDALVTVGDRVRPLYLVVHWPSDPFASALKAVEQGTLPQLLDLVLWQVSLAPEEEAELDLMSNWLGASGKRPEALAGARAALGFWLTMRRAGEVGERLGRELVGPLWARLPEAHRPRLHLVGHYFGARLLASAVLGGARADSVTLVRAACSAFAFADEVPGYDGPGFYHRLVSERRVGGPIAVVWSEADRALATFYQPNPWTPREAPAGSLKRCRIIVGISGMGLAGARGIGAIELGLEQLLRIGMPAGPVVNIAAHGPSVWRERGAPPIPATMSAEVAKIVLMAAGFRARRAA
jgi:hypothetical protein